MSEELPWDYVSPEDVSEAKRLMALDWNPAHRRRRNWNLNCAEPEQIHINYSVTQDEIVMIGSLCLADIKHRIRYKIRTLSEEKYAESIDRLEAWMGQFAE